MKYDQLGVAKITKNRNCVVSRCDNGGFTVAQQLEVVEGSKPTKVFLKGAIFVDSLENFKRMAKMMNDVVAVVEEMESTNWDDVSVGDEEEVDK